MASLPLSAILFREPHDAPPKYQCQEAFTCPAVLVTEGRCMPKQTIIFQTPTSLVVGPISRNGHPERRKEDIALELSLDVENEEPYYGDGREGGLDGIGAIFDGWMNIAGPEPKFHEEVTDCLAGIA